MVELTRDLLVDLGGWAVLKEARALVERGAVKSVQIEGTVFRGVVATGGIRCTPTLNLRSITFAENRCNCRIGQRGQVCAHAIAVCLAVMQGEKNRGSEQPKDTTQNANTQEASPDIRVKSIVLSQEKGMPARFKIVLPPNLARSAPGDKIMVKVVFQLANGQELAPQSIDRGKAYALNESNQRAGGLIESFCGGKLHGMLQLKRVQLSALLECVTGEDVVFWANKPEQALAWDRDQLPGVHAYLQVQEVAELNPVKSHTRHQPVVSRSPKNQSASSTTATAMEIDGSPHYLAIRLPSRESHCYHEALELLRSGGFTLDARNGRWWLRDLHKCLNFLADHLSELKTRFGAQFSPNFETRMAGLRSMEIEVEAAQVNGGFEFSVGVGDDSVSAQTINAQISKGKRYLETKSGIHLLDSKKIEQINRIISKVSSESSRSWSTKMVKRVANRDLCDLEEILRAENIPFVAPEQWKARSEAIRNLSKLKEAPVDPKLYERLRTYQKIGVAWLNHLYMNDLGGILADEMGLGKTVQAISLFTGVCRAREATVLVVCPAGLVTNWAREIGKFSPGLSVSIHYGANRPKALERAQITITSYSTLSRDIDLFLSEEFALIVGDEAQHIKNKRTQHAKALKRLRSRGRFLLTGTPIENSMSDLLSLFDFLMPGYLKIESSPSLSREDKAWQQQRIKERSAPYILRRNKRQVAPELPEKIEQTIYCEMDAQQKGLYEGVRRKVAQELDKLQAQGAGEGRMKMAAFTELLRLRQVCADPRILDAHFKADFSAKWLAFKEILDEAIDGGHRILVFSQFVSVLTLLREEMAVLKLPYCYIDGSTKDRLAQADKFNNDPSIPVFLISLKAGGTGLNLTGADTVVHYDPWWNPAIEAQATDRAHRIGQDKTVTSIRLIMSGTVEEKVELLQQEKRAMLKDLFEESTSLSSEMKLEDLRSLIEN